ncbi:hypothetical protein CEXT_248601 [Caerostris extrusa]|uniref:Uncharacterized protein n=1 Tax=Caerostris extrusa TaxID=172846 RepID=A0AAV4SI40_CAEEX|nr:hypothetical protein CEXT_248601 [Caerostris extrusa]
MFVGNISNHCSPQKRSVKCFLREYHSIYPHPTYSNIMYSLWLTIDSSSSHILNYVIMEPYCWKYLLYGVPLIHPHTTYSIMLNRIVGNHVSFDLSSSHIFQHYVFLEMSSPWLTIGFIIIPYTQLCYYGTILLEISPLWGTIEFILIPHTPLC